MKKIFSYVDGKTFESDKKFLQRLKAHGAKIVEKPDESDAIIVFCPIVSRFETDINSALSNVPGSKKVIVVALHHTYDPNYTVPNNRKMDGKLVVSCLFFEKKGLFSCPRNSEAKKTVYKELNLPPRPIKISTGKKRPKTENKNQRKKSA